MKTVTLTTEQITRIVEAIQYCQEMKFNAIDDMDEQDRQYEQILISLSQAIMVNPPPTA